MLDGTLSVTGAPCIIRAILAQDAAISHIPQGLDVEHSTHPGKSRVAGSLHASRIASIARKEAKPTEARPVEPRVRPDRVRRRA